MTIGFVVKGHVARVTIDRPDRMNAIDEASEAELLRLWSSITHEPTARGVRITGKGELAFCNGDRMTQRGQTGRNLSICFGARHGAKQT